MPSTASWLQDQPQEGVTPLPISSMARSSKRFLCCVPRTSHAGICAEMWFLWNLGYLQPCPACGMLNGQTAQPGLSYTQLPQCWPLVALGSGCCA